MTKARTKRGPTRKNDSAGAPPSSSVGVGGKSRLRSSTGKLSELIGYLEMRHPAMIQSIRHMVEMESPSHHKKSVDLLGERLAEAFREIGGEVHFHRGGKFGAHLQVDFASDVQAPARPAAWPLRYGLGSGNPRNHALSRGRRTALGTGRTRHEVRHRADDFRHRVAPPTARPTTATGHRLARNRRRSGQRKLAAHDRIVAQESVAPCWWSSPLSDSKAP